MGRGSACGYRGRARVDTVADDVHAEEITLTVPGFELAAKVWGPPQGRKVLALHGWLDNAGTYDRLAPMLPACRIVALDLPGHGRSSHAPQGVLYPFIDLVAAAHATLDALGWTACTLMGHSLGAGVSAILGGTVPDRVDRLVLLEGLGPLSTPPKDAPDRLAGALAEQARKGERSPTTYPSREHVAALMQASPSKLDPGSIDILLGRGLREVPGGVAWASDRRLRFSSRMRFTEPQVIAFLQRIACPTLLVSATDGFGLADALRPRLEAVADLRRVEVAGAHHVHLDDAAAVAPHVAAFLGPDA